MYQIKKHQILFTYNHNNYNKLSYLLKKSVFLIIFKKPKTEPVNWVFLKSKPEAAFSKTLDTGNPFTKRESWILYMDVPN